ncbi:MAG: ATP-binding protein [Patescibacteria group bacterium]
MEIISTYSFLPLVGSLLVFILGLFVWLTKTKDWLHIIFFLYNFTISIWLFGTFMLFNSTNDIDALYWDRFIYIGVVFIPIFLYHFGLIYCEIKNQDKLLIPGYILAFIFLPLSQLSDNFVSGLYKYPWGVHSIARFYHHLFLVYFLFYFIIFFANLIIRYKGSIGVLRTQVKYFLIGEGVLNLIGPLAFLPAYGVPIYPVIFLSAIPFAGILTYVIIEYRALDIRTIATEVVVSFLNVLAIGQIFFSRNNTEVGLRIVFWLSIFAVSIFLVRSVRKEVERREEIAKLADSLEVANLQLKELDKQKTDFLSIAAHQLRTPISIASGYLELLNDGAYGRCTDDTKQIFRNMDESNGRLIKLIDSFLDITRLEQGRTKYDFAEHDLSVMVDGVVKEFEMRAKQKGLTLAWQPAANFPKAIFDEEKIRHVVFNFIDNAIKYSETGTIKVEVFQDGDGVAARVRDNGIGFNKIDEANFFQKFYRGDNVRGTNVNGTGLGLFVCAKFIESHHGKFWAHSDGLGRGSEFGFWIPLHNA